MKDFLPQVSWREREIILAEVNGRMTVDGDVVELGCYAGDTSLELARGLKGSGKRLFLYDSFAGLPERSAADNTNFRAGDLTVSKKKVRERFLKAGLPVPVIRKAWFNELGPADLPERIAVAFLDGDFYESIRDSLRLAAPKMAAGGVVIVHDYANPRLPGVARAVDEWRGGKRRVTRETLAIISF
jgi:O-methyltransferase